MHHTDKILEYLNKASAVYIGPGLGQSEEIQQILRTIIPHIEKPCVLDADALDFLAKEDTQLPKNTILTPHVGEMMRLFKLTSTPAIDED